MSGIPISCKCITYGRVEFLEESIKSFLLQEYDGPKELVIINDCPFQKLIYPHNEIRIFNLSKTFESIGEKENFAITQCKYDTIAVWDDDDIALPNHLENINKYFPGYDLLHWNRGVFMNKWKIAAIKALGNSGIVYSKKIWLKVGGHRNENAGYDRTFVNLVKKEKGRICRALPPAKEVSWIYTWGGGSYHMSGLGTDREGRENVVQRHKKYIDSLKEKGQIPVGQIILKPNWKYKYIDMVKEFISPLNSDNLNGWAISSELFSWLQANILAGTSILEFGAGKGTIELAKIYNVYSVECNKKYMLSEKANYIYAPIRKYDDCNWYDINIIEEALKNVDYKAIIIDGPNASQGQREGFIFNLMFFNTDVPIIIDDTHRLYEQNYSAKLAGILNRKAKRFRGHEKSFDVILKNK